LAKKYALLNCKPNTKKSYTQFISNHINLQIEYIKKITPAKLQKLVNIKCRDGFGRNYLKNFYRILNSAFKIVVSPYQSTEIIIKLN
jgi:hypothetical protein